MNNKEIIKSETNYIFSYDFNDSSVSEEIEEEFFDRATSLLENYKWNDIFECWFDYLKTECTTTEEIINWANLFYWYGGFEKAIPNPYDFIGYLYYKVNIKEYANEAQTIFDSIAIGVLSNLGKISIVTSPNYAPETDPEIIAAVDRWKNLSK